LLLLLFHAKLCFAWVVRAGLRGNCSGGAAWELLGRGCVGIARAGLRGQLLGQGFAPQ
jgi:hypothetical protein